MHGACFKVYQDDAGQWRWRLQSVNGRILADSGEGYTRERDARRSVRAIKQSIWRAPLAGSRMTR